MVSVIVPVWNEAERLESLLTWLIAQPGVNEVIVADGESRDGTQQVVRSFPAVRLVASKKGRGAQMNAGARQARGDVLLFLHADTRFPHGALAGLPALLRSREADFGAFQIRFDPPVWLPQLLAQATRVASPWSCFGDQGIFVRRDFFWQTGGFPEIPLLEDVHWVRRAGRMGRMVRSPHAVISSARRFEEVGIVRQSLRNLSILILDLLGQDPAKLASMYSKGYAREKEILAPTPARRRHPTRPVAASRPTRIVEL